MATEFKDINGRVLAEGDRIVWAPRSSYGARLWIGTCIGFTDKTFKIQRERWYNWESGTSTGNVGSTFYIL